MDTQRTYYVMQCIEGDECAIDHADSLHEAKSKAIDSGQPIEALSIWDSHGAMLLVGTPDGRFIPVPSRATNSRQRETLSE